MTTTINMQMTGNPVLSYGKIELSLFREFVKLGIGVNPIGYTVPEAINWLEASGLMAHQAKERGEVTLSFARPDSARYLWNAYGTRRWHLTMSESTRVSTKWVHLLNKWMERVFVPTEPVAEVYRQSGVMVPVHVVPLGLDFEPIPDLPKREAFEPTPEKPFIWLTHFNSDMRKGTELALAAFGKVFNKDMRYRIWVKALHANGGWLSHSHDPQIAVVGGRLSECAWYELLRRVHGMVWPSRGEGFGLVAREATVMGVPSVATEWMGMHDVAEWGWPVRVKEMWPAQFDKEEANAISEGAQWAQPDYLHAAEHMKAIADDYPAALEKAKQGREYLMQRHTYAQTAKEIIKWL